MGGDSSRKNSGKMKRSKESQKTTLKKIKKNHKPVDHPHPHPHDHPHPREEALKAHSQQDEALKAYSHENLPHSEKKKRNIFSSTFKRRKPKDKRKSIELWKTFPEPLGSPLLYPETPLKVPVDTDKPRPVAEYQGPILSLSIIPPDLVPFLQQEIKFERYRYPVFGEKLAVLFRRSDGGPGTPPDEVSPVGGQSVGDVHYFFRTIFNFMMKKETLCTVGLFRVSGSSTQIDYYRNQFDNCQEVNFNNPPASPHDVAGLLKEWIRSLPEPLIPQLYNQQIPFILKGGTGFQDVLDELKSVIVNLPLANYLAFRLILVILYAVVSESEQNQMNLDNVIKCIAPTIGCCPALISYPLKNFTHFFGEKREKRGSLLRSMSSPDLGSNKVVARHFETDSDTADDDESDEGIHNLLFT